MPQVQVIQPIQQQPKRLRVAAYARVSSDSTDQLNSLSVQVDYYTHLIQENPNWDFAGIYADEGITGTSTKHREQFNRLLDDCRAGLIDRVLVTWSIHGRKQIVWRCVNRLEYGTKFCSNSPSIPETELHQAILKAVQNLAAKFTGEVADQLNGILHQIEVGESLTPQLQAQLEQNQQEFDHLLEMSLDFDENTPFLDDKLKRLSDKIKQLKTAITQSSVNSQTPSTPTNPITAKDLLITEYDDMLTARIIEKIIVKSRQDLEIIFIGGYTQQISLQ